MFSFGTQTNTNLWTFNDDKSGLQFSQTSDIENAYKDLFKRIFPDINLDPSTPADYHISNRAGYSYNTRHSRLCKLLLSRWKRTNARPMGL